jgi:hypothetical protein
MNILSSNDVDEQPWNNAKNANLALLDGMKLLAMQLQKLDIAEDTILQDFQNKISFYVGLIRRGRYLLATNHGLASTV